MQDKNPRPALQVMPDDYSGKMPSDSAEGYRDILQRLLVTADAPHFDTWRSVGRTRAHLLSIADELLDLLPERERNAPLDCWSKVRELLALAQKRRAESAAYAEARWRGMPAFVPEDLERRTARDLLVLAAKQRAESVEFRIELYGPPDDDHDESDDVWMSESDRLPDWAREDDAVEPLDYAVDLHDDFLRIGGYGWRIVRDGAVVGYAYESDRGLFIKWSEEAPEPYDPRSYYPTP